MSKEDLNNVTLRKAIEEEGLYEPGMTINDMKQVYHTLNRSKLTANDESEYRDLLSRTELNCSNIDALKEDQSEISSLDKSLDMGNNAEKLSSETDNMDVEVHDRDQDTDDEKQNSQNSENSDSIFQLKESPTTPKSKDILKRFKFKKQDKKNIDVFTTENTYKPLKLITCNMKMTPAIYHHPEVLKYPPNKRADIFFQYNLLQMMKHKQVNELGMKVEWGRTITPKPKVKFNGDLSIDHKPDIPVSDEVIPSPEAKKSEDVFQEDLATIKSKRNVKRRCYAEIDSEDDDFVINNKKTKANISGSSTETCTSKLSVSKANEWLNPPRKTLRGYAASPVVSSRTDKIFDRLKQQDDVRNKQNIKPVQGNTESTNSSDEEIFPEIKTIVDVHKESTPKPQRKPKLEKNKNHEKSTPTRSRALLKRNAKPKETDKDDNEIVSAEIPARNFYTQKSSANEVDLSNNNKNETTKNMTCPICCREYPISIIEDHAASCEQFEDMSSDVLCEICNKYIPSADSVRHRANCLKDITQASTEVNRDSDKVQLNEGFVCSVCDQFILDRGTNATKHASECIATIDGK